MGILVVIVIAYAIDDFCHRESNKMFGVFCGNCLQDPKFLPHQYSLLYFRVVTSLDGVGYPRTEDGGLAWIHAVGEAGDVYTTTIEPTERRDKAAGLACLVLVKCMLMNDDIVFAIGVTASSRFVLIPPRERREETGSAVLSTSHKVEKRINNRFEGSMQIPAHRRRLVIGGWEED